MEGPLAEVLFFGCSNIDKIVKLLYYLIMSSKHKYTVEMSWKIHRILNKFQRLESTPIQLGSGRAITHKELHVIQAIGEIKQINITEIGSHFGVTKSAASQVVSKLVKKGLVAKELAPHSGKEFQLTLTESGWEAYKLHENHHSKNIRKIADRLSSFSTDQIVTTSNMLDVIEGVVDERLADE